MDQQRRRADSIRARPMRVDRAIVDALVKRLTDPANSESAAGFPADRVATEYPGLYSWWADDEALSTCSTI